MEVQQAVIPMSFQVGVNGTASDRVTIEIDDTRAVALGLVTDDADGAS